MLRKKTDGVARRPRTGSILNQVAESKVDRRAFLRGVGGTTAAAAIASILPIDKAIANIVEATGPL
ncbi:MAG: twin-arginine translocation signal domain-containing protein, partial [Pseudomonadota bacterium]